MRVENPTKSSVPRCQHGVYDGAKAMNPGLNKPKVGCSLCVPIVVDLKRAKYVIAQNEDGGWKDINK
jgi:hypothetical protein